MTTVIRSPGCRRRYRFPSGTPAGREDRLCNERRTEDKKGRAYERPGKGRRGRREARRKGLIESGGHRQQRPLERWSLSQFANRTSNSCRANGRASSLIRSKYKQRSDTVRQPASWSALYNTSGCDGQSGIFVFLAVTSRETRKTGEMALLFWLCLDNDKRRGKRTILL